MTTRTRLEAAPVDSPRALRPHSPVGGAPPAPHTDGEVRLGRPSARPWPRPWRGLGAVPGSPAVRSGTALPSSSPPPALSPSRRRGPWSPRLTGSSALGSTPKPALPVRSVLRARPSPRPREPAGRLSPLPWRKPLGSPETPRACALRLGCPAAASSASPVLTPALSGAQAARLSPASPSVSQPSPRPNSPSETEGRRPRCPRGFTSLRLPGESRTPGHGGQDRPRSPSLSPGFHPRACAGPGGALVSPLRPFPPPPSPARGPAGPLRGRARPSAALSSPCPAGLAGRAQRAAPAPAVRHPVPVVSPKGGCAAALV